MTDNYQFEKSNTPESIDSYSPFTSKQWNYVPDINSGVYQSNGLSLVSWDLSSIYNSATFTDLSEAFITLPILLSAGCCANASTVAIAPTAGMFSLLSLKSNFINLVHQADLQVAGVSIEQTQPYINVFQNFRMMSEMSQNDIKTIGSTLGFSEFIDTAGSMIWNGAVLNAGVPVACANGGNGLCNNVPFPVGANGSDTQMQYGTQNLNVINRAIQQRVNKYIDVTNNTINKFYGNTIPTSATAGNLMNVNSITNELKCNYQVTNNIMTWSDTAVIKVGDLFDSMKQLGMLKKFDGIIRLYLNLGACCVNVTNPTTNATTYQYQLSNSTFTNTIPFTVNFLPGSLPANTATITASCTLISAPVTSFPNGCNLNLTSVRNPMTSCRFYYSQIILNSSLAQTFVESNRNKKVVYRTILSNNYTNVQTGTFNQLINGGIKNLVGVLIVPMIASSLLTFPQCSSPFDTFGATYTPLSITNVNASIGGVNFKMNPEIYTFENFYEEVNNFESLTASDIGVSVGLISQPWWESNRVYYLSSRSSDNDKATGRALNITFNNNSQVAIDLLVFTVYLDEYVVDTLTGKITK